jgi:hypothetical protein
MEKKDYYIIITEQKKRMLDFRKKIQWQLLTNRCYVLGGLSALNLI